MKELMMGTELELCQNDILLRIMIQFLCRPSLVLSLDLHYYDCTIMWEYLTQGSHMTVFSRYFFLSYSKCLFNHVTFWCRWKIDPPQLNTGGRQQTVQPETQMKQTTLASTEDQHQRTFLSFSCVMNSRSQSKSGSQCTQYLSKVSSSPLIHRRCQQLPKYESN